MLLNVSLFVLGFGLGYFLHALLCKTALDRLLIKAESLRDKIEKMKEGLESRRQ